MTSSIIILVMYYIITGLICYGRFMGESYKWYDRLLGFVFGFVLTPLLIGVYIRKNI